MAKETNQGKGEISEEATKKIVKRGRGRFIFRFIVFLLLVGLGISTAYYYRQYRQLRDHPEVVAQDEVGALLAEVSKIMDLPQDETPNVATISDVEKLKDQVFFKGASNGDKLIIYANAKEAILYRPSAKRIIQVAPLITEQQSGMQAQSGMSETNTQAESDTHQDVDGVKNDSKE